MKNVLSLLVTLGFLQICGCERHSSPSPSPGTRADVSAAAKPPGGMKDMMVLSDMYGICTSRVLQGTWTTHRYHDISSGTRTLRRDGVEHTVSMGYGLDAHLTGANLARIPNVNESKLFDISKGQYEAGEVLVASGIGSARGLTVQIDYVPGDPVAAELAMSIAATLVPCEFKNLAEGKVQLKN